MKLTTKQITVPALEIKVGRTVFRSYKIDSVVAEGGDWVLSRTGGQTFTITTRGDQVLVLGTSAWGPTTTKAMDLLHAVALVDQCI